jgi:hypothetical protein
MVDNVTLNAGSGGDTIATEDTGGAEYQKIKITDGTATSTTMMGVFSEDVASPAVITGPTVMMERDDIIGALTPIEGDWAALRCSAEGAMWVQEFNSDAILADTANIDTNIGTIAGAVTGTEMQVDIVAITPDLMLGTDFSAVLGTADLTTTALLADGIATSQDVLNVRNFNYVYNGTTFDLLREGGTAGSVLVDGSAVTQPVSGTVTANPASGTIDTVTNLAQMGGVAISLNTGVRDAGTQRVTIATNDVVPASQSGTWNITNVSGTVSLPTGAATQATLADVETNTDSLAVVGNGAAATAVRVTLANDSTGVATVDLGANNDIQGMAAQDAPVSGNPLLVGGYATNNIEGITEVGAGDAAQILTDLKGTLVTRNATTLEEILRTTQTTTATTSTALTNFGAPGAGNFNYVTAVTVYNSSATDTFVRLQNGNGGADIWVFPAPQTGGTTMNFDPPLKQTSAATALYFASGAAVTTMYISVLGFQSGG